MRQWRLRRQQRRFLENRLTPVLLLGAILLLSVLLAGLTSYFVGSQQRARFERESLAFDSALLRRMETYQNVLVSSRALWSTGIDIDRATFYRYTQDLNLKKHLPGALGLGFAEWVTPQGQEDFEVRMRGDVPGYRVRPPLRAPGTPIAYLEPGDASNKASLGYNMYSSQPRRAAMEEAYRLQRPIMTEPLNLIQDQNVPGTHPGVLLYLPVLRGGKLYGYAYMPVRLTDLVASLLKDQSPSREGVGLNIALYDSGHRFYGREAAHPVFRRLGNIKVAGRTWQVRYSASEDFGRDWAAFLPWLVLLMGTLVALSAYFSYLAQTQARERAEEVSESLRVSRAKLERSRAEFESIFRAISDTAIFTDEAGQVLFANDALSRQFGYTPQELRGQNIALLRPDTKLSPNMGQPLTTLYHPRSGQSFYGEMQRSRVVSEGGTLLGYLEVVHDITERLQAEQALKAGERRYQGVLEALPLPLWVADAQGAVTYKNAQYRVYFGQAAPFETIHPADQERYQAQWKVSQGKLQVFHAELRLLTQAGYRYFLVFGAPVLTPSGEVSEWVFSASDVHDRLQAERKARQNEERYREVLESMPQMVWLTDASGTPTYFNQRWYDYAGQQQDPLPLLHPDDRHEFARRWREVREGGGEGLFEMEVRLRGEAGGYHTFMTRGLGLRGPRGELTEWVVTATDIDDQVYAEWSSRLVASLSKQLLGSEYLPEGGHLGGAGSLRSALSLINERLAVLSALWVHSGSSEQAVGDRGAGGTLGSLISQARGHVREGALLANPQVLSAVTRASYLAEPVVVEDPSLQDGGVSGLVLLLLSPAREEGGLSTYLALGFRQPIRVRDLELVQEIAGRLAAALESLRLLEQLQLTQQALQELNASLERRVEERTDELAETNRELEAFSYSVSHDLRTPLRHIIAFAELLQKDADTTLGKKGTRYMGIIGDAAGRMNQLIDDLLEFSRTSRQPLSLGQVSLHRLAQDVLDELRLTAPGSDTTWHLEPLPDVLGDAALLRQVLSNLLGNAAKYSSRSPAPEVWITAHTDGQDVICSVRDNGVGFDPQYADKLFGVFQRLHRPEEFEGSGIGLANVRRILVRHGGRVWAESQPGQGATFFFSLKAYTDQQPTLGTKGALT